MDPQWLQWAKRLQAIAQIGLAYTQNVYDVERYEQIRTIAAEMMAAQSDADPAYVRELFAQEVGYATPKVDVRGVVFCDGEILLVKELSDGLWTLPGGWADVTDSPREAVEREVWEETGYRTRAAKLLAAYDREKQGHTPPYPYHVYKLFFRCDLIGGAAADSHETAGAAFFAPNAIPALSLSRVTPAQIVRLFEHYRHPDLPTDFD